MDALETKIERMFVSEVEARRHAIAEEIADNRHLPDEYNYQCGVREGLKLALAALDDARRKLYGER